MTFKVGDKVEWNSSNTIKTGEIVAVVPAGKCPDDVGYPKAGGGGLSRKHETYIVRGRKLYNHNRQPYGSNGVYWPVVSLLQAVE